ncbi:MAG: sigma 54-interacting transcriptional regulator [Novosphingobium sp.]|nr:sigma 54-interacting transcriptional regulator [Novosphingobium sp.]
MGVSFRLCELPDIERAIALGAIDFLAKPMDDGKMLRKLAGVPFTSLLIHGETGTGKGLAARILHYSGPRRSQPFMARSPCCPYP